MNPATQRGCSTTGGSRPPASTPLVGSSDLPEILSLADRILVMREGELQGAVSGATATEEDVMRLATREAVSA